MSLCRFSSDNWKCELYCYYDCQSGITTHVAANRRVGEIPEVPSITKVPLDVFTKAFKRQQVALDTSEIEPIGLPEDGKSFCDTSIEDFRGTLKHLRELGYNFPDYLFEIDEEPE